METVLWYKRRDFAGHPLLVFPSALCTVAAHIRMLESYRPLSMPVLNQLFMRSVNASATTPGATSTPAVIVAYDVISIVGSIFLVVVFVTAYRSDEIHRTAIWFLIVALWAVYSLLNAILIGQQTGPPPADSVCLFQAVLVYSLAVLGGLYAGVFMLHTYLILSRMENPGANVTRTETILLHAVPWVAFFSIVAEVLAQGLMHPETVQRDSSGLYCHISSSTPSKVAAIVAISGVIIVYVLIALIFRIFRRISQKKGCWTDNAAVRRDISWDVFTRMTIFISVSFLVISTSSLQLIPQHFIGDGVLELVQSTLGILAGLIFGSQRDMRRVLMFWKK